jgi:hypothetical protein
MRLLRDLSPAGRAAFGALCFSVMVLIAAAYDARRLEPMPRPQSAVSSMTLADPVRPPAALPQAVLAAVERDPFSADRKPAADRYRMPGEAAPAPAPPPASVPFIQLHGLITLPSGEGLAALYAMGRASQVVRVGQTFEGFTLERITAQEVVLVREDTTLTLRLRGR